MKLFLKLSLIILAVSIFGCNTEEEQNTKTKNEQQNKDSILIYYGSEMSFPELKKLSEYPNTDFIPTLENKISKNKNAIYCVTLLYTWDGIRNILKSPIKLSNPSNDLTLLNNSKSFINVLDSTEYEIEAEVTDFTVTLRANFDKSLPFEYGLYSFDDKLTFGNEKVNSFGSIGKDYIASHIIKILYYSDVNNFIIKLKPKDINHEIILFKTSDKYNTMSDLVILSKNFIEIGKKEVKNDINRWKYWMNEDDTLIIPKLKFNIEHNYESIENKSFESNNRNHLITKAWQKNSFILYEKGAGIRSDSEMVDVISASLSEEEPKPKKMIFDKPFFLMLKRKENAYPYFAAWITNSELMIKDE